MKLRHAPGPVRDWITLSDYLCYCQDGRIPPAAEEVLKKGGLPADLVKVLHLVGGLKPLGTIWPGPGNPVTYFTREFSVDPATSATVPGKKKFLEVCAPLDGGLWIELLRVTSANLTAADSGDVAMRQNKIVDFPDVCLPSHPVDIPGSLMTTEHFGMVAEAGFRMDALNWDRYSIARFHVEFRAWRLL